MHDTETTVYHYVAFKKAHEQGIDYWLGLSSLEKLLMMPVLMFFNRSSGESSLHYHFLDEQSWPGNKVIVCVRVKVLDERPEGVSEEEVPGGVTLFNTDLNVVVMHQGRSVLCVAEYYMSGFWALVEAIVECAEGAIATFAETPAPTATLSA